MLDLGVSSHLQFALLFHQFLHGFFAIILFNTIDDSFFAFFNSLAFFLDLHTIFVKILSIAFQPLHQEFVDPIGLDNSTTVSSLFLVQVRSIFLFHFSYLLGLHCDDKSLYQFYHSLLFLQQVQLRISVLKHQEARHLAQLHSRQLSLIFLILGRSFSTLFSICR